MRGFEMQACGVQIRLVWRDKIVYICIMKENNLSKLLHQCPLCQTAYKHGEIRLLGQSGARRMFHCRCRSCSHAFLTIIMETSGSVSSIGMITDMGADDAVRLQSATPLTDDMCILAHQVMTENSAEFCKILTLPRG